jgi:hypothetical protein
MVRQVVGANGVARGRRAAVLTVIVVLALAGVAVAAGSVKFDGSPGTGAPPPKLDGAKMQKFKRDRRPRFKQVMSVTGPTGQITFSAGVFHLVVRNLNKKGYWLTWSNGYRGDVYFAPPPSTTITLPAKTTAFYFYVEPNDPGTFSVTATASGTSSGAVKVRGAGGATFFGFVAKGGGHLTTIKVSSSDRYKSKKHPGGFAIGEFGIHKG